MTDDIVDWLREYGERNATYQCSDAADEIERLLLIKADWRAAMTENHDLWREIERLRAALEKLIAACDAGRRYEKGIGGMTLAAQLARTVIYGVSASAVEDARDALVGEKSDD